MALQTWTGYYSAVVFAANRNMGCVLNTHASEILRIRRVGLLNPQTAAIATPVMCNVEARTYRSTAGISGHTTITPTSHDTTNAAPASAVYGFGGTATGTIFTLRRVLWSSNEPAISVSVTADEMETFVPMNMIWGASRNADDEVLVLRQNEMFLVSNSVGSFGLLDTWIEFTKD